jgi:hypothetical protein
MATGPFNIFPGSRIFVMTFDLSGSHFSFSYAIAFKIFGEKLLLLSFLLSLVEGGFCGCLRQVLCPWGNIGAFGELLLPSGEIVAFGEFSCAEFVVSFSWNSLLSSRIGFSASDVELKFNWLDCDFNRRFWPSI